MPERRDKCCFVKTLIMGQVDYSMDIDANSRIQKHRLHVPQWL